MNQVVERYWGLNRTNKIIAEEYQDFSRLKYKEEQLNATNERYRHNIRRLKHENRRLGDCLGLRLDKRDKHIMRSVYRHIRDLEYENMAKRAEVDARWKENAELYDEYETVKGLHDRLLEEFGKKTAQEVFAMFPNVWEAVEERKHRRNFS